MPKLLEAMLFSTCGKNMAFKHPISKKIFFADMTWIT